MPIIPLPDELRKAVVRVLTALPNMDVASMRRTYLHAAFSDLPLPGVTEFAAVDIIQTLRYFDKIGTLEGGQWPVQILLDHVLDLLPSSSALAAELRNVRAGVARYYSAQSLPPVQVNLPPATELEAIIDDDDTLPFPFMEKAIAVANAVGILSLRTSAGSPTSGTCWMLTPRHVITNWHVLACLQANLPESQMRANTLRATIRFGYWDKVRLGEPLGDLAWVCGDESMDYAILALPQGSPSRPALKIALEASLAGRKLNVVQHALGGPLSFAIRENDYVGSPSPHLIHYLSDTQPGSSGAPVCDDEWTVVALHHAARPVTVVVKGRSYSTHNEGVLMSAILKELPAVVRQEITVER